MAYTSGIADNYKDLLAKMVTFASANGWVVLGTQTAEKVCLRGPGLNIGTPDEIYVEVETYEDTGNNRYNWKLAGMWGWRDNRAFGKQPGSSEEGGYVGVPGQEGVFTYLCNTEIPYWMSVNGRRIILIANCNGYYNTIHLGLLTPIGTDAQYPYPLLIGGSGGQLLRTWGDPLNAAFWGRLGNYAPGVYHSSMRLSAPGGTWWRGWQYPYGVNGIRPNSNSYEDLPTILTAPDGTYLLEQLYITSHNPTVSERNIFGQVEGLFMVSGHLSNNPENIITVSGVNYIVTQDVSRSGNGNLCCMRMD
jgi:hypothetical protein